MRSTAERMKLLEKRTKEIKKRHNTRKYIFAVSSFYSVCIVLITAVSVFVRNLNFIGFEQMPMSNTASIFTQKVFLGYVVVGILSFLLGISVTLLCNILHKMKKAREKGK